MTTQDKPIQDQDELDELTVGAPVATEAPTASVADLLAQLGDEPAPTSETVDKMKRSDVPDGDYLAVLTRFEVKPDTKGQLRVAFFSRSLGLITSAGLQPKHVGAGLPIFSSPITSKVNEKGNRSDFMFWNIANAILGDEQRKEIQKGNPTYKGVVQAILAAISAKAENKTAVFGLKKDTRKISTGPKTGQDTANVARVYARPSSIPVPQENSGVAQTTTVVVEDE